MTASESEFLKNKSDFIKKKLGVTVILLSYKSTIQIVTILIDLLFVVVLILFIWFFLPFAY